MFCVVWRRVADKIRQLPNDRCCTVQQTMCLGTIRVDDKDEGEWEGIGRLGEREIERGGGAPVIGCIVGIGVVGFGIDKQ